MGLKVLWTDFAEQMIAKIFRYYLDHSNLRVARSLTDSIIDESYKLSSQPQIGQIEIGLEDRSKQYRYLIYKNFKIVYWINSELNQVEIVDVFDARQNPDKLSRNK